MLERANFYDRIQNPGESYSEYALALKHIATHCEFGSFLDSCLRDRFVMGIRRSSTRVAVIRANKTAFNEVVAEAQAYELTEKSEPGTAELGFNMVKSRRFGENKSHGRNNYSRGQSWE